MTAVFGFAGVSLGHDGIALDPQLPPNWRSLGFSLQWRSRRLRIKIVPGEQRAEAMLEAGEPMKLVVNGQPHELRGDRTLRVSCALRAPPKGYTDAERRQELLPIRGRRAK